MISPDDFRQDPPSQKLIAPAVRVDTCAIAGVRLSGFTHGRDGRGTLRELLSQRAGDEAPIVHVYQVEAEAGSVRAWVYHNRQTDRLCFTQGSFRVVLFDIRPDSPSRGELVVIEAGHAKPLRIDIPPFVVHGVQNRGERCSFVNMPTRVYDPADPDKWRLPVDDPRIPYRFDET